MGTVLIALALYATFVVSIFILRFILWIVDGFRIEHKKRMARLEAQQPISDPLPAEVLEIKVVPCSAAFEALQEQKETIEEILSDIETQLDFCPPEKIRNQLLNRKSVLLGKLSTCEKRIAKMRT